MTRIELIYTDQDRFRTRISPIKKLNTVLISESRFNPRHPCSIAGNDIVKHLFAWLEERCPKDTGS
jgi:hypothetical protein